MKFYQTLASVTGFRDPAHNARRLALLDEVLTAADRDGASLILLPGGYLSVRTESDVVVIASEVRSRAHARGVAVIGGIDGPIPPDVDEDVLVRGCRLPFFGFAVGPVLPEVITTFWRQSTIRNSHPDLLADDRVPGGERIVTHDGCLIGVLVCGELSNWRVRQLFAASLPALVVDVGHAGMGQGLIPGMKRWNADLGCAVAHAQHVRAWGASHHFVTTEGVQDSVPTSNPYWVGDEEFWLAWRVREI